MLWFEHPVTRADLETAVRERRSEGTERRCVPSSVPFYYSLRVYFLSLSCNEISAHTFFYPALLPVRTCEKIYRHLTTALNALARLHIVTFLNRTSKQNGRNAEVYVQTSDEVVVSPRFRENLRIALTGG
jgi:hypothetical protein